MAVTPGWSIPLSALTDSPNGPAQMDGGFGVIDTALTTVNNAAIAANTLAGAATNLVGGKRYTTTATLASAIAATEALVNIDTGAVPLPANSFFRITAIINYQAITSSLEPDFAIRDTNLAGAQIVADLLPAPNLPNPNQVQIGAPMQLTVVGYFKTTTAVTKTFVATGKRLTGTGTISVFGGATNPSSMIIERLGASSLITDV